MIITVFFNLIKNNFYNPCRWTFGTNLRKTINLILSKPEKYQKIYNLIFCRLHCNNSKQLLNNIIITNFAAIFFTGLDCGMAGQSWRKISI